MKTIEKIQNTGINTLQFSVNSPKNDEIIEARAKFRKNRVGVNISAIKKTTATIKNMSQEDIIKSL